MSDKLSICLIGPSRGGKTSMLATLTDCVTQRVHGYPPDLRPTLQSISQEEFDNAEGAGGRLRLLGVPGGSYDILKGQFASGIDATDTINTYEYFFRLELNGRHPGITADQLPVFIQVIDAAGEIAIPSGDTAIVEETQVKFDEQIMSAEALVFVVPLVNLEETDWIYTMSDLIDRIVQAREKKLQRLVVAFAQYERLFVRLGPSAFTYACHPDIALHIIRECLQAAPWLDGLRSLENPANGGVSVRFTVTSAYGFAKTFRNPNIDPHVSDPGDKRFRRQGLPINRALNEFWRPFLTAEPILYAALKQDSVFTFSYRQIDNQPEPEPPPSEPDPDTDHGGKKRPGGDIIRAILSWLRETFDVNRR